MIIRIAHSYRLTGLQLSRENLFQWSPYTRIYFSNYKKVAIKLPSRKTIITYERLRTEVSEHIYNFGLIYMELRLFFDVLPPRDVKV